MEQITVRSQITKDTVCQALRTLYEKYHRIDGGVPQADRRDTSLEGTPRADAEDSQMQPTAATESTHQVSSKYLQRCNQNSTGKSW